MSQTNNRNLLNAEITIDFEEFCVVTSYLTILHEGISESGCVSPIKGTNLPPPPIFLTNTPGKVQRIHFNLKKTSDENYLYFNLQNGCMQLTQEVCWVKEIR